MTTLACWHARADVTNVLLAAATLALLVACAGTPTAPREVVQPRASAGAEERADATALGDTGPLVVFLPGLGGTSEYFRPAADSLARSARVLLVDPLGFGASAKPSGPYTMDRHVAALRVTLRGGPPAVLVGHSFGARLAIAYAARYPTSVRALVLYSLPYYGGPAATRAFFQSGAAPGRWVFSSEVATSLACVLSRRLLGPLLPMLASDLPPRVVNAASSHTWRSASSTLWSTFMQYDLRGDLDALPTALPVYLLHGASDPTAPLDSVQALTGRHPEWRLRVLPATGHHPWWTAATAAHSALDTLLASGFAGRATGAPDSVSFAGRVSRPCDRVRRRASGASLCAAVGDHIL